MPDSTPVDLRPLLEVPLADELAQLRAVPVQVAPYEPDAILFVHSAHPSVDPFANNFTLPSDTLRFTLASQDGDVLWRKDLGPGIVPGVWFCPVFPFDLDGDGVDEIWYVDTDDPDHPFSLHGHRLARIDPETGETTGTWEWPGYVRQSLSHTYRNFILGGHVRGEPVLVTAQGTYGEMNLQAWNPDMDKRWVHDVPADAPGARGSHMTPVLDIDDDGADELLWGERLIELDAGTQRFCADRDTWDQHSDVILPALGPDGEWFVYTCREKDTHVPPRVVLFDDRGRRVWSAIDEGHMHRGWVARVGPGGAKLAMAGRNKNAPREDLDEFVWDAFTGEPRQVDYPVYSTLPVDVDGDGRHELVYTSFDREGRVVDREGADIGAVDANVARALPSKLLDHPGEQIVSFEDGVARVWGDAAAADAEEARARYENPYYRKARRLSAVGYNVRNLGGL